MRSLVARITPDTLISKTQALSMPSRLAHDGVVLYGDDPEHGDGKRSLPGSAPQALRAVDRKWRLLVAAGCVVAAH